MVRTLEHALTIFAKKLATEMTNHNVFQDNLRGKIWFMS